MAGVLLLLLSWWGGELVDGHVHVAPHGGKIAHLGALHLELKVDEHQIRVWLLDQKLKPVPVEGRTLLVTLTPKEGKPQTPALTREGDHLRAAVSLPGLPELAITAELKSGRRSDKAVFRWSVLDARERIDDSVEGDGEKL
jgi:hypothetical protein